MRVAPAAFIAASLVLSGCGGGQAELDILELAPAGSTALPRGPAAASDAIALDVVVRSGQLRLVLARGGAVDLSVFDCAAPETPGTTVPVYFASEPVAGLAASQVSDDPDMLAMLNVSVPRRAISGARPCARFVGRPGLFAPEVTGRSVPLPGGGQG